MLSNIKGIIFGTTGEKAPETLRQITVKGREKTRSVWREIIQNKKSIELTPQLIQATFKSIIEENYPDVKDWENMALSDPLSKTLVLGKAMKALQKDIPNVLIHEIDSVAKGIAFYEIPENPKIVKGDPQNEIFIGQKLPSNVKLVKLKDYRDRARQQPGPAPHWQKSNEAAINEA